MIPSHRQNRRSFLRSAASGTVLAASAFAAPMILPRRVFGSNERIAVGAVGVRNQGSGNIKRFLGAGADVVAICDVDSKVAAAAAELVGKNHPQPKLFSDYRQLLEEKGIDAVVITTPDHWHAMMTIDACRAGKDVYCEKPLSLTIAEGRRMVKAARDHQRIVQTGSQQRSADEFWRACMLVRNGLIGDIKEVFVGIPGPNHPGPIGPEEKIPADLNYDLWLGPAPMKPYHSKRVHYNFRFWWDYSGGQMTNFGAHHLDIAQWALGMDNSGPVAIEGSAEFHPQMVHEVTEKCRVVYTYANGVKVTLGQGQKEIAQGAKFVGTKGSIYVNRGKLVAEPVELETTPLNGPELTQLYRSKDHTQNFLDCIRSRELPICDVEIGHRSATVCHLGNIAARLGRPVKWDPAAETCPNDPEAQEMTDRPYRSPWKV
ncbi:MAG: Gfo/Idh/MocA family protein [Planctomycetota bacterium]